MRKLAGIVIVGVMIATLGLAFGLTSPAESADGVSRVDVSEQLEPAVDGMTVGGCRGFIGACVDACATLGCFVQTASCNPPTCICGCNP